MISSKSWIALLFLSFTACGHWASYYDLTSYKNLTDLKAETAVFMDQLQKEADQKALLPVLRELRLNTEKAYEYERGKSGNANTIAQLEEIRAMIAGLADLLMKKDRLPPEYLEPKRAALAQAFDLAIQTEASKLKEN